MKGGYWLMPGVLLAIVIGVFMADVILPAPEENNKTNQSTSPIDSYFAAANNFVWSLATNPQATIRNGALAVELAEYACERTHYQKTIYVGTLAAAYAEAGRFEDAIATVQKAMAMAEASLAAHPSRGDFSFLALAAFSNSFPVP